MPVRAGSFTSKLSTALNGKHKSKAHKPAPTCMRKHQLLHACQRWQQLHQRRAWQHKPRVPASHEPAQRTRLHWGAAAKQRQLLLLLLLLLLGLGNTTCQQGDITQGVEDAT
jgi:hypothetical protein